MIFLLHHEDRGPVSLNQYDDLKLRVRSDFDGIRQIQENEVQGSSNCTYKDHFISTTSSSDLVGDFSRGMAISAIEQYDLSVPMTYPKSLNTIRY
jgi:hypothetical protein